MTRALAFMEFEEAANSSTHNGIARRLFVGTTGGSINIVLSDGFGPNEKLGGCQVTMSRARVRVTALCLHPVASALSFRSLLVTVNSPFRRIDRRHATGTIALSNRPEVVLAIRRGHIVFLGCRGSH